MTSRPEACDWRDVQGLVVSGYKRLIHARYSLWSIVDVDLARRWVADLAVQVTHAGQPRAGTAVNVAFSCSGLVKLLRLSPADMSSFPWPFQEGQAGSVHRSRILGDTGSNAPDRWTWGGPLRPGVDVLLMLFAQDEFESNPTLIKLASSAFGLRPVARFESVRENNREPFGFADGLSQPILERTPRSARKPDSRHVVKLGEMLLGYPNNSGEITPAPDIKGCADFGLNGSYLVARQLEQHVADFWKFMQEKGPTLGMSPIELAEKMVGRTKEGCVLAPDGTGQPHAQENEFGFAATDPFGEGCPLGAHIRRGNPRDTLDKSPVESWRIVNSHRILRRGRAYREDGVDRGLFFIALVGDIERQFEFVQQNWINDTGFGGLRGERDPLLGRRGGLEDTFTMPANPLRRRVSGIRPFITTRGGEYFFLPGLHALSHLATP